MSALLQQHTMTRIIAIVNQKGGVGKSTTAVNLGASLAMLGRRVLIVDIDPQGNATTGVGIDKRGVDKDVYSILLDGVAIRDVARETGIPNLALVPSTLQLAGAEIELVSVLQREGKLKAALAGQPAASSASSCWLVKLSSGVVVAAAASSAVANTLMLFSWSMLNVVMIFLSWVPRSARS